jgi:hypothetical protein
MRFATIATTLLFAGCLGAQTNESTQTETKTTTTSTNVNLTGTLLDQGCYTTHKQTKETTSSDANSTTTTVTTNIVTQCPATTTTTSFGLVTPEGKFVRFDEAGNTRIVEMVKSKKDWRDYIEGRKPVTVRVVGTANGDVVVIKEIQ